MLSDHGSPKLFVVEPGSPSCYCLEHIAEERGGLRMFATEPEPCGFGAPELWCPVFLGLEPYGPHVFHYLHYLIVQFS